MEKRKKITKIFIVVILIFKIITPIFILSDRLFVSETYFPIKDLSIYREGNFIKISNSIFWHALKINNVGGKFYDRLKKQNKIKIYYTKVYKIPIGIEIMGIVYKTKSYNQFNLMFLFGVLPFMFLSYTDIEIQKPDPTIEILSEKNVKELNFRHKAGNLVYYLLGVVFILFCLIPIIGFFIVLF